MRRLPVLLSAVAVVVLGLVAAARIGSTTAQESDGPDLAGSWRVVVSAADGRTFLTLSTFGADGTVLTSGLPAQQAPPGTPPGVVFVSTAHGAWAATGADTANATFVHLRANADGQPLGTITPRLGITLGADGQTFSGEFVTTLADPAGKTLATFSGTIQATRIVAEAPGMPPAGTPAA
ncbi:MAG TPA: hypothetical protein VH482_13350 [Thermomicrobiales bacterium]|jgi:hypothetical protein